MDVKYSYYNTSKGYRVTGGTAAQFLKADGSLDNTSYAALNGVQTFTNVNTFSQSPVIPAGTLNGHAVNVGQLNNNLNNYFPKKNTVGITVNLNDLTLEGIYYGYQWVNSPLVSPTGIATVTVKKYSNDWIRQEFDLIEGGTGLTYVRDRHNGTTWGDWKIVANRDWVTSQLTDKVNNVNSATGVGFNSGNADSPFMQHSASGVINLATQNWVSNNFTTPSFLAQNYALRAGSNATDTWVNTSYGLTTNPYIPGKTFNASGACYLQEATYGSAMGFLNSPGTGAGNPTDDWWFRLKMLHSNANGYYGEIGVKMTGGGNSLRYKRFENGVDSGWIEVWDKQNLTQGSINNWNAAYNNILSDILNFNNNQGDFTRYYKLDGSSFDKLRIGTGIVDTRVMGNGLGSDGSSTFLPNSGNKALNHKLLPLFHEVSGRGFQSSLILKGWTDAYRAWRITGPADVSSQEGDFFLSQTVSDTGKWLKERKIWTDKHFSESNINSWNYAVSNGIQLNLEFTTNTGEGLVIADNHTGNGESGIIDANLKKFVATKRKEYYFYGSDFGTNNDFEGLNYHWKWKRFGMGRKANENDKLTVEGSVKAGGNFKSDDENPNTVFIPNGKVANLTDEIINDEADYTIRLDPHEYEFGSSSYLDIGDRNRLIHVIGNYVKMTVNFKEIFPKQQIVIYNFSEDGNPMAIRLYDQTIYKVNSGCLLRLYVTRSLRVIAEREQPIEMIW
ncbi:pyocin knob domain-containing protein [Chryseobacterium sp. 22458]|uniref:pyocin knob domain-containing protein n=1 Tax=Chryseobacterium sp. 22458 TaxID=3453921 RepID=UPI003F85E065